MATKRNKEQSGQPVPQKPLRLWPGIVIVIIQWLLWYIAPLISPDEIVIIIGIFGSLVCALGIIVWWAFFSRAPRMERWGAFVLMIVALFATSYLIDKSISTAMQGAMFVIYTIPVMSLAFVLWAVITSSLSNKFRQITMVATILLVCIGWALIRTDGMSGEARHDLNWRWAATSEAQFLAQVDSDPGLLAASIDTTETEAEWPGFRGRDRDGIIEGVQIDTDWSSSPPIELWRKLVGPGCSSFAIHGDKLFTQEQRGDDEVVSCYNLSTGDQIWIHRDSARFWDSHAGAGPRSTPTLSGGLVYTLGATGILNVLNEHDGSVVWSRNAASDINAKLPGWGFASSPLVVDSVVIVALAGAITAYDIDTGEPRWFGLDGGGDSYSSPHLVTIEGIPQVLFMSGVGVTSFSPSNGTLLWEHPWPSEGRIVQPALTTDGDLLLSAGGGQGMRRISVDNDWQGWKTQELWTSSGLKPSFNDFVIHNGHAYGFVGPMLACIDIYDGTRKWRGGRYGGFMILLADQGLLVILTEKGEVALVEASPDQFTELALLPAIEGKTWNHPAFANNILVVRNSKEMVAFQLPHKGD